MGKNVECFVNDAGILPIVIIDRILKCSAPMSVVSVCISVS